ncbi:hypothetical protein JXB01_02915 [Candidatus Micrarchaeota archaeon]|nr:hypothetical protein [Candidatus Micrarchaeota archaeon]
MVDILKGSKKSEEVHNPLVDSFTVSGKLKSSFKEISKILSAVSFLEVAPESNAINVAYVESRDINGKPYTFTLLRIKKEEASVVYSIPPNIAPNKRKLDVVRYFINILNLMGKNYQVETRLVFSLIEDAVKGLGELIDKESSKVYIEYDTMKKEVAQLRSKASSLKNQNEELKNKIYELKNQNEELTLKLSKFEAISDESLKTRLVEWIRDHSGKINIPEFSKVYNISEGRVEDVLNMMVTEGYLSAAR